MQKDGRLQPGMPLHEELISVSLDKLTRSQMLLALPAGENKVEAILSALQGKNTLIH